MQRLYSRYLIRVSSPFFIFLGVCRARVIDLWIIISFKCMQNKFMFMHFQGPLIQQIYIETDFAFNINVFENL